MPIEPMHREFLQVLSTKKEAERCTGSVRTYMIEEFKSKAAQFFNAHHAEIEQRLWPITEEMTTDSEGT